MGGTLKRKNKSVEKIPHTTQKGTEDAYEKK